MEKTTAQLEKNVSASFGYVKKDILMLNDSYTHIQEALSQILASHDKLASRVRELEQKSSGSTKKASAKKPVKTTTTKKSSSKTSSKTSTTSKGSKAKPVKKVVETITYS